MPAARHAPRDNPSQRDARPQSRVAVPAGRHAIPRRPHAYPTACGAGACFPVPARPSCRSSFICRSSPLPSSSSTRPAPSTCSR
ncbi:hypothetical protein F01_440174 [Burkholderia cenocepacia]|nr:hypothetical protein F01_440174 [Burkholderia cenocepacia]